MESRTVNEPKTNPGKSKSKNPSTKGRKLATVIGAVIILIIIIAVATSGGNSKSNKKTTKVKPVAAAKSVQPQVTTASKMKTWYGKYGTDVTSLTGDYSQASKDASSQDEEALLGDCQKMGQDVTTAQSHPGIPDNAAEQHWSSALSYTKSSAQDCVSGINNNDPNQIQQAATELTQAANEINATTKAILAVE